MIRRSLASLVLTLSLPFLIHCGGDKDTNTDTGTDEDGDGYTIKEGDCDDSDPSIYPGAPEVCDDADVDEDCDGYADDSDPVESDGSGGASGKSTVYPDGDGDGLGDSDEATSDFCDVPATGWAVDGGDCNDADDTVHPGATDELLADRDCIEGIADNSLSLSDYSFAGENAGDSAGWSVSSAGDVDGDGLNDILVGAYVNDDGGSNAGKTYLILGASLGSTAEIDLSLADFSFVGEASDDYAGHSISSAGDVDGDGLDDILVGAYGNDDGGWWDAGKAYLILGASLGSTAEIDLSLADYSFVGEGAADNAGYSVSSAGDVDGDGLDDILVGAPTNGEGKTYLILGASLGSTSRIDLSLADYSFVGRYNDDRVGHSVSSAGDVDGDGLDDLLVGAYYNDDGGSNAGKAYLILGASLGSTAKIDLSLADYSFVGESASNHAGSSVSSAGDVDGDGLDDILVGAYGNDDGGSYAGKTYLILGTSLGSTSEIDLSLADFSFVGETDLDRAGTVSSAGDVDGDGLDDILVGAHYNGDGGSPAGKAYLILSGL